MDRPAPLLSLLVLTLLAIAGCSAPPQASTSANPTQAKTKQPAPADQPLPKVLIIGDSISMGYHKTVVELTQGVADVSRIPMNGQWAGTGVKKIDVWLGDTRWDVIHVNFGLWDMYGWEFAKEDLSPKAYGQRLEKIITRLKQTDATLIWATTTPACPAAEVTMRKRFKTDVIISEQLEQQYLDAAAAVMKKHNVRINDLHALVKPDLDALLLGPDNVHFTKAGKEMLGKQVAAEIKDALGAEVSE